MFILTKIADLIQIAPQQFDVPSIQALEDNINAKYADKVVHKIGLCICLYDILKVSDGNIGHGSGIVNVNVTFRMIVFRPFKGEIIEGTIGHSSAHGMRAHVNFFTDMFIPKMNLFDNTTFEKQEGVHVWRPDPSEPEQALYFDIGEPVWMRVESEVWDDQTVGGPTLSDNALADMIASEDAGYNKQVSSPTIRSINNSTGTAQPSNSAAPSPASVTAPNIATAGKLSSISGNHPSKEGPSGVLSAPAPGSTRSSDPVRRAGKKLPTSPYGVVTSMAISGLGPIVWWRVASAAS